MKTRVRGQQVSLGSFSVIQHPDDSELSAGLLRFLAQEAGPSFGEVGQPD
jgi:hypothetical protein